LAELATFWTKARVRRLAVAVLLGLIISILSYSLAAENPNSLLARGDFPAFYAAAVIACQGRISELYNPLLQQEVNALHWPQMSDAYLAFAYPPYVAQLLSPLCHLPPDVAKLVFTLAMLLALLLSVRLITRISPDLRESFFPLFVFCFSFSPVFIGVIGGQNVALSMLFYAGAMFFAQRKHELSHFAAGLLLGLLFFKPHYGVLSLLLVLSSGAWLVALGMIVSFCGYFTLSAEVLGTSWPLQFFYAASQFSTLDFVANKQQMVSVIGVTEALGSWLGSSKTAGVPLELLAAAVSAGLFVLAALLCFRLGKINRRLALETSLLFIGPVIVLLSPHSMYYDLGICFIPLAFVYPLNSDRRINSGVLLIALSLVLSGVKDFLPFQPLALLAVYAFASVYRSSTGSRGCRVL
jgi:alpha-1,2-mannosyltransferase